MNIETSVISSKTIVVNSDSDILVHTKLRGIENMNEPYAKSSYIDFNPWVCDAVIASAIATALSFWVICDAEYNFRVAYIS